MTKLTEYETGVEIMVRIQVLPNDVLFVDSTKYIKEHELSPNVQQRFLLLRTADPGTRIKGVGYHMEENTYWIYEDGDSAETVSLVIALDKLQIALDKLQTVSKRAKISPACKYAIVHSQPRNHDE